MYLWTEYKNGVQVASCIQFEVGSESAGDVNLKGLARHVLRNINHIYENVQRWRQKSSVAALESDAVALAGSQSLPSRLHCSHRRQEGNILSFSVSDIFPSFHVTDIVGLEPFRYCTELANSANHTPVRGHYPNFEEHSCFVVSEATNAMKEHLLYWHELQELLPRYLKSKMNGIWFPYQTLFSDLSKHGFQEVKTWASTTLQNLKVLLCSWVESTTSRQIRGFQKVTVHPFT